MKGNFVTAGKSRILAVLGLCLVLQSLGFSAKTMLNLSNGVIVTAEDIGQVEQKAVLVLQQEIQKRTGIEIKRTNRWPANSGAVIAVGVEPKIDDFAGPFASELKSVKIQGAEGFCLIAKSTPQKAVVIVGKDECGMLYGIGRLLRKMYLSQQSILVPDDLNIVTSPRYPLRGHQLGYRPKTNAYDAWSVEQFDQYIRELALFGTNSIEILPPRTDDEATSRHMKTPGMEMMIRLSEIIDSYGLNVWIWYPNMGKDYTTEKGIKAELDEREEIFKKLKRIDHILVPGGDPGHLHPDVFFPWMDRVAEVLAKYHPKAKIWVSPQAMQPTREWLDSFYTYVNKKPKWLGGVVFAPWVKTPLPEMRRVVDKEIPIRHYPDITHNVACQYPVRGWDLAFALTLHRECFNPRPVAMKTIHNAFDQYACGSLTYSEGINDDINKFIWGDQDWDPKTEVIETLHDYCRLFINPKLSDELAQGFMAQERNWEGPLAANTQVDVTLQQWRDLENAALETAKNNYRFQMGLMRAYYDAYIRQRLIYETDLEMRAMDTLRQAGQVGSLKAMDNAEKILRKAKEEPVAQDYRKKCDALADSLFELIGSQLTVEKHGAQHRTRGGFMDGIDEPLNNASWLMDQFREIRDIKEEKTRLAAIDKVVNRTDPGPGGFYDNMGSYSSLKRIVNPIPWEQDPGTLQSPRIAFDYTVYRPEDLDWPLAWKSQVGTIYETPLRLAYDNLDPQAQYKVRVAYTGRRSKMMELVADDVYRIHGPVETLNPPIREFEVPKEATADGRLELMWTCGEGQRGSQVSEIWLIKESGK
jgi:hypothetical protein